VQWMGKVTDGFLPGRRSRLIQREGAGFCRKGDRCFRKRGLIKGMILVFPMEDAAEIYYNLYIGGADRLPTGFAFGEDLKIWGGGE
jgi:hypothetical protein